MQKVHLAVAWLSPVLSLTLLACGSPAARVLDAKGIEALNLKGDAIDAKPGDIVIESSKIVAVIQRPVRDIGPAPYGGNLIDLAAKPALIDRFGELQPFFNLGRTASFTDVKIIADGANGSPIVVEARGTDAIWDYINIAAIQPELIGPFVRFDANKKMGVDVVARYKLPKDGDRVTVEYRITPQSGSAGDAQVGFAVDTGGAVDFFSPSTGFGALRSFDSNFLSGAVPMGSYFGIVGAGVSYGVRALPNAEFPTPTLTVAAVGIAVSVLGSNNLVEALTESNATLDRTRVFSIEVAPKTELDEVVELFEEFSNVVKGRVVGTQLELQAGVRVNAISNGIVVTSTLCNELGEFTLHVGKEAPVLQAETLTTRSAPITAAFDKDTTLSLPSVHELKVNVKTRDGLEEDAPLVERACKVSVIAETPFAAAAGTSVRNLTRMASNAQSFLLPNCNTEVDGKLFVGGNRYLVQVTKGPEFEAVRAVWDTTGSDSLFVNGELKRVVQRGTFVAADFHQHTINSPDSIATLESRVFGNLAEGVDFFTSSDHDRITDFAPLIASLNLQDELATAPGVELTTFPFGHFNAWPLNLDNSLVSNGSVDWGTGDEQALLPAEIFEGLRARGASVVQANHPRTTSSVTYQAYFDRAALVVDPDTGRFAPESDYQFIPSSLLRLPEDTPLFSAGFDALEMMNGFPFGRDAEGRPIEVESNAVMRDWLGFLAFGFRPTAVGVSDAHGQQAGYPRTYVDIGGAKPSAATISEALRAGRAVASNGVVVRISAGDATRRFGLGALAPTDADGHTIVDVEVEANPDYDVDRIELFVNTRVLSPGVLGEDGSIARPALVPTYTQDVTSELLTRGNGGKARLSKATFDVAVNKDSYVVARVRGQEPLYPFLVTEGGGTVQVGASDAPAFFSSRYGAPAYAITNPIYLDRDGDGKHTP